MVSRFALADSPPQSAGRRETLEWALIALRKHAGQEALRKHRLRANGVAAFAADKGWAKTTERAEKISDVAPIAAAGTHGSPQPLSGKPTRREPAACKDWDFLGWVPPEDTEGVEKEIDERQLRSIKRCFMDWGGIYEQSNMHFSILALQEHSGFVKGAETGPPERPVHNTPTSAQSHAEEVAAGGEAGSADLEAEAAIRLKLAAALNEADAAVPSTRTSSLPTYPITDALRAAAHQVFLSSAPALQGTLSPDAPSEGHKETATGEGADGEMASHDASPLAHGAKAGGGGIAITERGGQKETEEAGGRGDLSKGVCVYYGPVRRRRRPLSAGASSGESSDECEVVAKDAAGVQTKRANTTAQRLWEVVRACGVRLWARCARETRRARARARASESERQKKTRGRERVLACCEGE